ncbi:MAG: hypothetical protein K2X93_26410, partial [Candidatus Obscuribacterales bacterium]|nr:hypothetical protein [Candidatus Obscuribacterales bacterium]
MKQRQIDRLMKRVPAIAHLLNLANQRWKHNSTKDRINIKTKRADQDLLFHSPEPFWRWMIPDSKMVGVVSEIISAVAGREIVDSTGSLDPRHGGRSKVVRQLLAETQANIDLLVRAEVVAWYQNDGNCRPGQFVEREIQFSVYPAPTKGFHDLLSTCDGVKNVHLRIPGMVSYIRADDLAVAEVGTRLEELA